MSPVNVTAKALEWFHKWTFPKRQPNGDVSCLSEPRERDAQDRSHRPDDDESIRDLRL